MGSHEEGMSREHLQIRRSLRSLPLCRCPVGFEFRLQKRLEGGFVSVGRQSGPRWTVGWAGLGLGVATAAAIAIFAFDFNGGVPALKTGGITAVPTAIEQSSPVALEITPPRTDARAEDELKSRTIIQTPPQVAATIESKAVDAQKDSLDKLKNPTTQTDFPAQTVGTNPQPR